MRKLQILLPGFESENDVITRLRYFDGYMFRKYFDDSENGYLKEWAQLHKDLETAWQKVYEIQRKRDEYRQGVQQCRAKLAKVSRDDKVKRAQAELTCQATEAKLMEHDAGLRNAEKQERHRCRELEQKISENQAMQQYKTILEYLDRIEPFLAEWRERSQQAVDFFESRKKGGRAKVPAFIEADIEHGKKLRPMRHKKTRADSLAPGTQTAFEYIE